MSGAGRKHRAKHLTRQYLDVDGWVGPKEGEALAVCLESPHGQHVRVLLVAHNDANVKTANEQLVFLPGKFHKVIWLRIKDVIVVSGGTVVFKPSPEQVENFLKDPAHLEWRERIVAAQQRAEEQRVAMQRMPQYSATAQTTTSALTGPQVHQVAQMNNENAEGLEGDADDDSDEMEDLVNPNWHNIKHHQQFFHGMDDDSDEEEEGEEGEYEQDK